MFCPKCGSQVPDNAAFCGKCGNKFEPRSAAQSVNTGSASSASSGSAASGTAAVGAPAASPLAAFAGLRITPVGIVSIILAVIAVIVSLMPWYELSSLVKGTTSLTSGLGTLLGASKESLSFQDSYAVWNLVGLANSFANTVSTYSLFGGSQATGAAGIITLCSWICLIGWLVSLGLTIWGSVTALIKGKAGILRIGTIFMIVTVIFFYFFTAQMGEESGVVNMMPAFCLVLSIAALVCTFAAKKKA